MSYDLLFIVGTLVFKNHVSKPFSKEPGGSVLGETEFQGHHGSTHMGTHTHTPRWEEVWTEASLLLFLLHFSWVTVPNYKGQAMQWVCA